MLHFYLDELFYYEEKVPCVYGR